MNLYLYLYFNQYLYLNHTHTNTRKPFKKKQTGTENAPILVSGKHTVWGRFLPEGSQVSLSFTQLQGPWSLRGPG